MSITVTMPMEEYERLRNEELKRAVTLDDYRKQQVELHRVMQVFSDELKRLEDMMQWIDSWRVRLKWDGWEVDTHNGVICLSNSGGSRTFEQAIVSAMEEGVAA